MRTPSTKNSDKDATMGKNVVDALVVAKEATLSDKRLLSAKVCTGSSAQVVDTAKMAIEVTFICFHLSAVPCILFVLH